MVEIKKSEDNTTSRIESFIALKEGEYWKAKQEVDTCELVPVGSLCLVIKLDYVDNAVHTVYLRLPPNLTSDYKNNFKMLIGDFLSAFEHVEKEIAEKLRQNDILAIQEKLKEAQRCLQDHLANPSLIDAEMAASEDKGAGGLPISFDSINENVKGAIQSQEVSALMSTDLTKDNLAQVQFALEGQKNIAVKRSEWMQKKTSEMSQIAAQMTPYFEEQAAVALAQTQEARERIDTIMKGIGNLNLYVLKNVKYETLKQGHSASEDIPLTITQSVLYMDEELAVWEPVGKDFDYRNQHDFFKKIAESQSLIEQIFPTERSIVGIATTRSEKNYSKQGYHAIEIANMNKENQTMMLLVRDGENIHVVISPELWHQSTRTLFPSLDEMERPFKGFNGKNITYNNIQYTSSLKSFEKISLMYKRLLILLCGLDHKESLFGDFYQEPQSLNFISEEFQEKYFRFVHDADGTGLLANTKRPIPFYEWIAEQNTHIGKGSHMLFIWSDVFSYKTIPSAYQRFNQHMRSEHDRELLYTPNTQNLIDGYLIQQSNKLVLPIHLSGDNLNYEHRKFKTNLDVSKVLEDAYPQDMSFICLDGLNIVQAKWYLHDRSTRTKNIQGIKLLKAAINFVEEIELQEAKPRDMLVSMLIDGGICTDTETANNLVRQGVAKWKSANRNKDLHDILNNHRLANGILDQLYRLSEKSSDRAQELIEYEKSNGREVLMATILANGDYASYVVPFDSEKNDRLFPHDWVIKTNYKPLKKGFKSSQPKHVDLTLKPANETVFYRADDELLKSHTRRYANLFTSFKQKETFLEKLMPPSAILKEINEMVTNKELFLEKLNCYWDTRLIASKKNVDEPELFYPIGAMALVTFREPHLQYIGLSCTARNLFAWVVAQANNKQWEKKLISDVSGIYKNSELQVQKMTALIEEYRGKPLKSILTIKRINNANRYKYTPYITSTNHYVSKFERVDGCRYSIDRAVNKNVLNGSVIELHSSIDNGLDELLDISKPTDHCPCYLKKNEKEANIFPYDIEKNKGMTSGVFDSIAEAIEHIDTENIMRSKSNDKVYNVTYKSHEVEPRCNENGLALKSFDREEIVTEVMGEV